MKTLEKLHAIEDKKIIYDIHYCKAGVGFIFYSPPEGYDITILDGDSWKKFLTNDKYYDTFEKAVAGEYLRLKTL